MVGNRNAPREWTTDLHDNLTSLNKCPVGLKSKDLLHVDVKRVQFAMIIVNSIFFFSRLIHLKMHKARGRHTRGSASSLYL